MVIITGARGLMSGRHPFSGNQRVTSPIGTWAFQVGGKQKADAWLYYMPKDTLVA